MLILRGIGCFSGITEGKVAFWHSPSLTETFMSREPSVEQARVLSARAQAQIELEAAQQLAERKGQVEAADVLAAQLMMLEDYEFEDYVTQAITDERISAVLAVRKAQKHFTRIFQGLSDSYLRSKEKDVDAITHLVLSYLSEGEGACTEDFTGKVVFTTSLTTSDILMLKRRGAIAIVVTNGAAWSHEAILAKSMSIPVVMGSGTEIGKAYYDSTAIVDSYKGLVYINPSEAVRSEIEEQKLLQQEREKLLSSMRGLESCTQDGRLCKVLANISGVDDLQTVQHYDAEGIGLFRTEMLFTGKEKPPTEEEQYTVYATVVRAMAPHPVTIRTLDIGAGSSINYLGLEREHNPALGIRGIRMSLRHLELFRTQLRAILRAASLGDVGILLPMVVDVEEVRSAKEQILLAMEELDKAGRSYGKVRLGIMIETPAAALLSDELAQEVAFFSIGTNDLLQYTLAADRSNEALTQRYSQAHRAMLRLVTMTAENAAKAGIPVGICGSIASELSLTSLFLDLGITELSVPPQMVLSVRQKIRSL